MSDHKPPTDAELEKDEKDVEWSVNRGLCCELCEQKFYRNRAPVWLAEIRRLRERVADLENAQFDENARHERELLEVSEAAYYCGNHNDPLTMLAEVIAAVKLRR